MNKINYKSIISNKDIRFKILKILEFIPDVLMVKIQYKIKTGKKLDLKNPKRFNEKIQFYKLYHRDPLMTKCADKYNVRKFVRDKGYEEILIPIYGIYDAPEDIDFTKLPNQFVLKTNNGSHTNIICKDKESLDISKVISKLSNWLYKRSVKMGREWAYYDIKPKIICEKYMIDESSPISSLNDYKFICFNGKVEYVWIDIDRFQDHTRNFYDREWNYLAISTDFPTHGDFIPKPEGFQEMLKIAEDLAKDFPHVRVDLYYINGKVFFGELTFYLLSGYEKFSPDKFDFELGEKFNIESLNNKKNIN